MRLKLLILLCVFLSSGVVYGENNICFKFFPERSGFFENYSQNDASLRRIMTFIDSHEDELLSGKSSIQVMAYTGQEGDSLESEIASQRADRLKSELITRKGLHEDCFVTSIECYEHDSLSNAVAISLTLVENEPKPQQQQAPSYVQPKRTSAPPKEAVSVEIASSKQKRSFGPILDNLAIKSNLLPYGLGVFNVGVEYFINDRFSIDFPLYYSPYTLSRNYMVRVLALQPEGRYWFEEAGAGHFVGAHLQLGWYNIALNRDQRHQDRQGNSPAWGFGAAYGFGMPLNETWGVEFTAGVGYLHLQYDTFYNVRNGAKIDTHSHHYWGITKLGVSFIYRFNR